jgi:site-specific DNA-methyltransferase (adenine-specific)
VIICDDVLHWAETYDGPKFHALCADPPYSLGDGKRGFMNATWDTNIAFRHDTWQALAQHLLPGAFGACFASARGWHRLACAIEDAGLVIHPSIFMLGWAQGSGFPKASRIDTQIDKAAGLQRCTPYQDMRNGPNTRPSTKGDKYSTGYTNDVADSAPATPLAAAWAGHRYGLQAMKPALEPIILWQKPYEKRPVDSITTYGAGSLWVDGARVPAAPDDAAARAARNGDTFQAAGWYAASQDIPRNGVTAGRWPPNFCLVHAESCVPLGTRQVRGDPRGDCAGRRPGGFGDVGAPTGTSVPNAHVYGDETVQVYQCAPECPVFRLDAQAGERRVGDVHPYTRANTEFYAKSSVSTFERKSDQQANASRFFPTFWADAVAAQLAAADPVRYCAKASARERAAGLEGFEAKIGKRTQDGGDDTRGRPLPVNRNPHPTVKPISLCTWLATLLLPPAAYAPRRVLIPFSGSGSECIAASLAGWEEVIGVDNSAEYCALAEARLAHHLGLFVQGRL